MELEKVDLVQQIINKKNINKNSSPELGAKYRTSSGELHYDWQPITASKG